MPLTVNFSTRIYFSFFLFTKLYEHVNTVYSFICLTFILCFVFTFICHFLENLSFSYEEGQAVVQLSALSLFKCLV